mmetsp:Transcript_20718/g.39224  ORF Transcript_20718/g.39224 Transcript_20718/m.39224 type:complete len:333 (-) Transcript_20718:698-1696(-)
MSTLHPGQSTMTSIMQNEELATACRAVTIASKLCEAVRSEMTTLQTMTKSDRSPVTVADYGSQAVICEMLSKNFPEDPVVAEEDSDDLRLPEMGDQLAKITNHVKLALGESSVSEEDVAGWIDHGNGTPSSNQRFWTLDPIDGTKGFLRGDQYAVCLALIENGHVKIGIIGCPALEIDHVVGHLFVAEKGKGAWRKPLNSNNNDTTLARIQVDPKIDILVQSFEASHGNHTSQQDVAAKATGIENVVCMDSQAKYAMVANGKAALYLRLSDYAESIWDHAAGVVLVEEAGGRVSDRNGKRLGFTSTKMTGNSGVIVTNGVFHEKVLAVLEDY